MLANYAQRHAWVEKTQLEVDSVDRVAPVPGIQSRRLSPPYDYSLLLLSPTGAEKPRSLDIPTIKNPSDSGHGTQHISTYFFVATVVPRARAIEASNNALFLWAGHKSAVLPAVLILEGARHCLGISARHEGSLRCPIGTLHEEQIPMVPVLSHGDVTMPHKQDQRAQLLAVAHGLPCL